MWTFFLQIVAGILGLFLATRYVSGVDFTGSIFIIPKSSANTSAFFGSLVFVGIFLGFLNSFIRPILNKIALPLRIITFNLFSIIIFMGMIWITDVVFTELNINGIIPLFWTTIIVWGLGFIFLKWMPAPKERA